MSWSWAWSNIVVCSLQIVPASAIPDGWMGLDIGPDSIKAFNEALGTTKTVIWNGPMGVFEFDKFAVGTEVWTNCLLLRLILQLCGLLVYMLFKLCFYGDICPICWHTQKKQKKKRVWVVVILNYCRPYTHWFDWNSLCKDELSLLPFAPTGAYEVLVPQVATCPLEVICISQL